jgi:hypothetical protein
MFTAIMAGPSALAAAAADAAGPSRAGVPALALRALSS